MILSDQTLKQMLSEGSLKAEPLQHEQIQSSGIDFRLGNSFRVAETSASGILSMEHEIPYRMIESDTYLLLPHQFVLATTQEYFALPEDVGAFVEGRSSLGRMGLFIQNAGWIPAGFQGEITLELYNANHCAIELKAGSRIGQLVFAKMDQKAQNPYQGKYQGQRGATGSKVYLDVDNKEPYE